jgi:hypothetical protein
MEALPKASTPEEELAQLREEVARRERELVARDGRAAAAPERPRLISERIVAHQQAPAEAVLAPALAMNRHDLGNVAQGILLSLELKGDEAALAELARMVEEKGVKNALGALERLGNPQLADDFHRFLVRYIASGMSPAGEERGPRFKALHMTLYSVALPEAARSADDGPPKPLKELLSSMEQLYAGLLSVGEAEEGEPACYALELAVPADSRELRFYAAVPDHKRDLFEKQLLAIFPGAELAVEENDFNIFSRGNYSAGASAALTASPALPLKDYSDFDYDPLNALTNAFAKIAATGEGAALQIIVEPRGDRHVAHYKKILQALRKGEKKASAFSLPESALGEIARDVGKTLFSRKPKDAEKAKEAETRQIEENKNYVEQVEKKLATPIVGATIRLAVSAGSDAKAERILAELAAAFNQFANTQGNALVFTPPKRGRERLFFEDFSFRVPAALALPLSLRELTTLYHFPPEGIASSPHLAQARFAAAPAPVNLPQEGILLGINRYRGQETQAHLGGEDRLRHFYAIGQTGAGKSTLLMNMIAQDIKAGAGCCYIDPHGADILDILAAVPPERYEDVIYFDPADLARPFGLNFLEYDATKPEQKTFIVNELLMIFRRLYGDVPESLGPAFEQYFRNATQLVMEDPSSGSTILDIARVLSNANFRKQKLAASKNPIVNQFWQEIATKAGGEASLENIVPYITNKFDDFTANDFIRPIVGQQESSFNFRRVMDEKKILLVNLSKGRLGEKNANLLGLIIVGKLFMAALSRADNPKAAYPPFYLYIDEFQNVTTDSVPGILSEARKYKLSLTIAHQFLAQIEDKFRDAIFGNVGNMAVFRVGQEDAEIFAKLFSPVFTALDFTNIENRNAYLKILARGVPQKPFNIATLPPPAGQEAQIADLIQLSALTYGRDRATIEETIRERYLA